VANNTLGSLSRLLAEHDAALRHHQHALQFAGEAGYRQGEAAALIGLAQTQAACGCQDEARAAIERALLTTRQTGLRVLEGHALTALADIALESGLRAEAEDAALAVHRETGHAQGETRALRILDLSRGAHRAPRT
jgi:ATP/maltotriose-dependent transcriptional regulator MalT